MRGLWLAAALCVAACATSNPPERRAPAQTVVHETRRTFAPAPVEAHVVIVPVPVEYFAADEWSNPFPDRAGELAAPAPVDTSNTGVGGSGIPDTNTIDPYADPNVEHLP